MMDPWNRQNEYTTVTTVTVPMIPPSQFLSFGWYLLIYMVFIGPKDDLGIIWITYWRSAFLVWLSLGEAERSSAALLLYRPSGCKTWCSCLTNNE